MLLIQSRRQLLARMGHRHQRQKTIPLLQVYLHLAKLTLLDSGLIKPHLSIHQHIQIRQPMFRRCLGNPPYSFKPHKSRPPQGLSYRR